LKYKLLWFLLISMGISCTRTDKTTEPVIKESTETAFIVESKLPAGFDIEGHRGARGLKPENTLPAFETALDLGVTTLELDLHLTADNEVVIWHDDHIESNKCGLDPDVDADVRDPDSLIKWGDALSISQLTYAQIKAFLCDRNPDPDSFIEQNKGVTLLARDDYHILSLAELFEFVESYSQADEKSEAQRANAAQVQFNIETKRKPDSPKAINDDFDGENPGIFELEILKVVEQYGLKDRVIIQSFDHRSLWAIRSINADIRLAALTTGGNADITGMAKRGANIWSPRYTDLTPALITKAHNVGLLVIPWTVNDVKDMGELIEMGVDGIISDRPDILLNLEP